MSKRYVMRKKFCQNLEHDKVRRVYISFYKSTTTCVRTISETTLVGPLPIRIIITCHTIVAVLRIFTDACVVDKPTKPFLAASFQCARQPVSRIRRHVVWLISIVPFKRVSEKEEYLLDKHIQISYAIHHLILKIHLPAPLVTN